MSSAADTPTPTTTTSTSTAAATATILAPIGGLGVSARSLFFYDPATFPRFAPLVEAVDAIAEEAAAVSASVATHGSVSNDYSAWVGDDDFESIAAEVGANGGWVQWWNNRNGQDSEQWTIYGFYYKQDDDDVAQPVKANCDKCPVTAGILSQIPGIRVAGFSRMLPHTKLEPHVGFTGKEFGALAFHMGVIIPSSGDVALQCGPFQHNWRAAGETIVFDDTYTHSAWNFSDEDRIILYIDFETDVWTTGQPVPILKPLALGAIASDDSGSESEVDSESEGESKGGEKGKGDDGGGGKGKPHWDFV